MDILELSANPLGGHSMIKLGHMCAGSSSFRRQAHCSSFHHLGHRPSTKRSAKSGPKGDVHTRNACTQTTLQHAMYLYGGIPRFYLARTHLNPNMGPGQLKPSRNPPPKSTRIDPVRKHGQTLPVSVDLSWHEARKEHSSRYNQVNYMAMGQNRVPPVKIQ